MSFLRGESSAKLLKIIAFAEPTRDVRPDHLQPQSLDPAPILRVVHSPIAALSDQRLDAHFITLIVVIESV